MRSREQRVVEGLAGRNAAAFFAPKRGRHQIELIDRDDLELGKTDAPQLRDERGGVTDEELAALLRRTWGAREDRYSELRSAATEELPRVEMSYIGG